MLDNTTIGSLLKSECKKLQSQESLCFAMRNKFVHIFFLDIDGWITMKQDCYSNIMKKQVHNDIEGSSTNDISLLLTSNPKNILWWHWELDVLKSNSHKNMSKIKNVIYTSPVHLVQDDLESLHLLLSLYFFLHFWKKVQL